MQRDISTNDQGYTDPLTDGALAERMSHMAALTRVEELRRRGLADIGDGYPERLGGVELVSVSG